MSPRPKKERILSGFPARVDQLIGQTSYRDFETRCGLRHSIVKNILEGGEPSRDKVEAIIRGTGCDARWLITGEGEPFGDKKSPPTEAEGLNHSRLTPAQAEVIQGILACQNTLSDVIRDCLKSPLFAQQVAESVHKLHSTLKTSFEAAKVAEES